MVHRAAWVSKRVGRLITVTIYTTNCEAKKLGELGTRGPCFPLGPGGSGGGGWNAGRKRKKRNTDQKPKKQPGIFQLELLGFPPHCLTLLMQNQKREKRIRLLFIFLLLL